MMARKRDTREIQLFLADVTCSQVALLEMALPRWNTLRDGILLEMTLFWNGQVDLVFGNHAVEVAF